MDRYVCKFSSADRIENWKIRTEPGLMLSGPCALGLAVNNALGNEPLSKYTPGLLKSFNRKKIEGFNSDAIGNVMILSVSRHHIAIGSSRIVQNVRISNDYSNPGGQK